QSSHRVDERPVAPEKRRQFGAGNDITWPVEERHEQPEWQILEWDDRAVTTQLAGARVYLERAKMQALAHLHQHRTYRAIPKHPVECLWELALGVPRIHMRSHSSQPPRAVDRSESEIQRNSVEFRRNSDWRLSEATRCSTAARIGQEACPPFACE